ncbi:MAG: DegT/DnrJ/EryC1/StrS family aminotransferase [Gammaproteobacteria bacterium]|nr:DegT/DnrJ/EryC1/StrS family aminotransferase [Gammaproteobacteria bacterium]
MGIAKEFVQLAAPHIEETDIEAVVSVLRSPRLANGPKVLEFEQRIAEYTGAKYAVAVSSGTAALHIIVRALGLQRGDEVLVPSFTFAATVNALLYEGVMPVFVDIEPDTFNLDPEQLKNSITKRTKAIMAVDIFGHPAEWDEILNFADNYGLKVIDDACEALGAEFKGKRVGSFGDAAAFAFYPNKQITTGEGGMIVTNNKEIAQLARSLRNQGRGEKLEWLLHERLGFNYRMDEMSAALGVSQLDKIEGRLRTRRKLADLYTKLLEEIPWVEPPKTRDYTRSAWFAYTILLSDEINRDAVMREMRSLGVETRAYFPPVHQQPYIKKIFGNEVNIHLPYTEYTSRRTLSLPLHSRLKTEEVHLVVDVLREAVFRVSAKG